MTATHDTVAANRRECQGGALLSQVPLSLHQLLFRVGEHEQGHANAVIVHEDLLLDGTSRRLTADRAPRERQHCHDGRRRDTPCVRSAATTKPTPEAHRPRPTSTGYPRRIQAGSPPTSTMTFR
jgi:hypothetical protein